MKYLIAIDSSASSEAAFNFLLKTLKPEVDEVFVLIVAEEANTILVGPYADYSFLAEINKQIEDNSRDLVKEYGRQLRHLNVSLDFLRPTHSRVRLFTIFCPAARSNTPVY